MAKCARKAPAPHRALDGLIRTSQKDCYRYGRFLARGSTIGIPPAGLIQPELDSVCANLGHAGAAAHQPIVKGVTR
jgi:hypothetical protein